MWQASGLCVQRSRANLRIVGCVQLLDWMERCASALREHANILSTSKQPLSKPFSCVYRDGMVYDDANDLAMLVQALESWMMILSDSHAE